MPYPASLPGAPGAPGDHLRPAPLAQTSARADTDDGPPLAISGWTISPADRRLVTRIPHRIKGRLQGVAPLGLALTFAPDTPAATVAGEPPPRWTLAAGPTLMLGRRLGIPESWPAGRSSLGFVELTVTYALNRYTVDDLAGRDSRDLGFHRLELAAGVGRAWRHARFAVQGVAGYGGVYDGTALLERGGRRHAMPAFGLAILGSHRLMTLAGLRLGVLAQAAVVHHAADPADLDHWYGFAPSIRLGLVTD